jgi:hypothetical protein
VAIVLHCWRCVLFSIIDIPALQDVQACQAVSFMLHLDY